MNVILLTAVKSSVPTLTHAISSQGGYGVCGVTSLGDDIFLVRYDSQRIEVYDSKTFTLQRHIAVPGLGRWPIGIAACARNRCIYLSDYDNERVCKVKLKRRKSIKKWSVASGPAGLSVNSAHNLIVACCEANRIQEYRPSGSLVREITLQSGVTRPWHAVQLTTGLYVLCQFTSPGVVTVVGLEGQVVRRYGQSHTGPKMITTCLAVTHNDSILVADQCNNRILLMNTSLSSVEELALSVDDRIQLPCSLHLDVSRGRLYIGEWGGQHRVLVFDGVTL